VLTKDPGDTSLQITACTATNGMKWQGARLLVISGGPCVGIARGTMVRGSPEVINGEVFAGSKAWRRGGERPGQSRISGWSVPKARAAACAFEDAVQIVERPRRGGAGGLPLSDRPETNPC